MHIERILNEDRTFNDLAGSSKKRALQNAAHLLGDQLPHLQGDDLFRKLVDREQLGSTGIGEGIAIPHCRLSGATEPCGALFKLATPIDFDSPDDAPVDLIFTLIVPLDACDEHLAILGELAGKFSQAEFRSALRNATSSQQLFNIATGVGQP